MQRRSFLKSVPASALLPWANEVQAAFPSIAAVAEPHFPNRIYQFVWRNWELANLDRMAKVVGSREFELTEMAASMGLPPKRPLSADYLKRIYITVIRQNWHLLPETQIMELLGWDADLWAFTLKEDDFLDHKLGRVKPLCEPLRYRAPDSTEKAQAASIRATLSQRMSGPITPGQPRFAFVEEMSKFERVPDWRIEVPGDSQLLTEAARRFPATKGPRVKLVITPSAEGSNDFTLVPENGGVRVEAASERAAIRALYALRGMRQLPSRRIVSKEVWSPRFLYSYFALYGDPLMETDSAGLPDGYLDRAAANGIDGVWIQGVLNKLAPSRTFPEFGNGWQTRLKNLRALVNRASRFGLRVHLYLNEPRDMPAQFFERYPHLRGTKWQDGYAMCTSTPYVLDWVRSSLSHVFDEVPDLGGILSITMSENHTNCFSHGGAWGDHNPVAKDCPRCSKRTGAETIAELIQAFRDGIRAKSKTAEVMSYDWGWGTPLAQALIPKLPRDTSVISISEWSTPVDRGGVRSIVGEYSMSVVGPGPRASANWKLARANGLKAIAKTQFNNTWEISAVPYIPVLPLVLDHCEGLRKAGIDGVMASWTCGGYPSSNLRAASLYAVEPHPDRSQILREEAARIYGPADQAEAVRAWEIFSEAFGWFPYGVAIYVLPVQHGPANPLRLRPTGLAPGMILFPYDAYKSWKGAYPPAVVQQLMAKVAKRWSDGVVILEKVAGRSREARLELAVARTCHTHFESTANQVEFCLLRDEAPGAAPERERQIRKRLIEISAREGELARMQYVVSRDESLIGYEASNHYYYTPLDLLEKILNCEQVTKELKSGGAIGVSRG